MTYNKMPSDPHAPWENKPKRGGQTYDEARDEPRLNQQHTSVLELMKDGRWRTLERISEVTGIKETSVSARLRDLRKVQHGSHTVEREHLGRGLWLYRVVL